MLSLFGQMHSHSEVAVMVGCNSGHIRDFVVAKDKVGILVVASQEAA